MPYKKHKGGIKMDKELNGFALGSALAILSSLCMLLIGILGNLGLYTGAVKMMQAWHIFFSLSVLGILAGIIEAAIVSFIFGWLLAFIYNKFV